MLPQAPNLQRLRSLALPAKLPFQTWDGGGGCATNRFTWAAIQSYPMPRLRQFSINDLLTLRYLRVLEWSNFTLANSWRSLKIRNPFAAPLTEMSVAGIPTGGFLPKSVRQSTVCSIFWEFTSPHTRYTSPCVCVVLFRSNRAPLFQGTFTSACSTTSGVGWCWCIDLRDSPQKMLGDFLRFRPNQLSAPCGHSTVALGNGSSANCAGPHRPPANLHAARQSSLLGIKMVYFI